MNKPTHQKKDDSRLVGVVVQCLLVLFCSFVVSKVQQQLLSNHDTVLDSVIPLGAHLKWSTDNHGTPIATLSLPSTNNTQSHIQEQQKEQQSVSSFIASTKEAIMTRYNATGLVLLRGFPFANSAEANALFEQLTDHNLNDPNVGPIGFLPGWLQTALYDLTYGIMLKFADGKRSGGLSVLGPVSQNIQGPHQEGQLFRWRWPQIGFYVEVAPETMGETVLYDAAAAFRALPPALRQKVQDYEYCYRLHFHLFYDYLPSWLYNIGVRVGVLLTNNQVTWNPLTLLSPSNDNTDEPCLQWFGFGKNSKDHAAAAFNQAYSDRNVTATACHDYNGEYFVRRREANNAINPRGVPKEQYGTPIHPQTFAPAEERAIMDAFMTSSRLLKWETNDFLLVDNIRWAHGRANGNGKSSPRVLHFYKSQPMVDVHSLNMRRR